MPDEFDIHRQWDNAAQEDTDAAMDRLEDSRDKAEERRGRLVRLDEDHYFDPHGREILVKNGESFVKIGPNARFEKIAAERIEEEAARKGYTPVAGGLFWDAAGKNLYIRNGGHYVLMRSGGTSPGPPV